MKEKTLHISGMTCQNCVKKVEATLAPLAKKVTVTLNPPQATLIDSSASLSVINQTLAKIGKYQASLDNKHPQINLPKTWFQTYRPLLTIFAYILGVTFLLEINAQAISMTRAMSHFMAGFFLVFSFFKLLDIRAFSESYAMYDLLAKRVKGYGTLYPFLEAGLGIAYLTQWNPTWTNLSTLILMGFSSLGVIQAVWDKKKIRCACLGSVFNLPMTTVTIIEDLLMVAMAGCMLIF
jgi:copper chaperone CopZ